MNELNHLLLIKLLQFNKYVQYKALYKDYYVIKGIDIIIDSTW